MGVNLLLEEELERDQWRVLLRRREEEGVEGTRVGNAEATEGCALGWLDGAGKGGVDGIVFIRGPKGAIRKRVFALLFLEGGQGGRERWGRDEGTTGTSSYVSQDDVAGFYFFLFLFLIFPLISV